MTRQRANLTAALCWVMIIGVSPVQASTQVNFHGTLIDNPPCDITGDNDPIYVDFDEVGITKIDGINYMQDFTLTITCGSDLGNNVALYMGYDGMNAPFDRDAVQTDIRGLGIRLYYKGEIVAPNNDDIPIVMSSGSIKTIALSAVPVKDDSIDLLEGPFNATGTVEIRYP
ncbi:fimbrial protein [Providencia sp. 2023EL-00965]|nr:fimbrial protein [Providencia sp. 2023EL-00965]